MPVKISELPVATPSSTSTLPVVVGGVTSGMTTSGMVASALDYVPVIQRAAIVAGTSTYDATAAIVAALAANDVVKIPAGLWNVSTFSVGDNKTIITDNFKTIIQQIAGQGVGIRIICITGSNVNLGSLTVRGNISTDTDEQNHGILLRGSTTQSNIRIGAIIGENIRGDVLICAGLETAALSDVFIESVHGINIYRNVVSNVGGSNIQIGSITASDGVGYALYDEEPNGNSCPITDCWVGYIKGGVVQVAGLSTEIVGATRFGVLDLDPSYQTNSTPTYSGYDIDAGLRLRNVEFVGIDVLKGNGYNGPLVEFIRNIPGGDIQCRLLEIGWLEATNCSLTDATYNTYILAAGGVERIVIRGGEVTLGAATKGLILGDSTFADPTQCDVRHLTINGSVAKYVERSRFEELEVNSAYDAYLLLDARQSKLSRSNITLGRLFGNSLKCKIEQCTVTAATFLFNGGFDNHLVDDSTLNGTYYKFAIWQQSYLNAIHFGARAKWIDANNHERFLGGVPTSDTDGLIVGIGQVTANVGDAAASITPKGDTTIIWNTPLTADRAVTFTSTSVINGVRKRIVRTAAATGAFNLNVSHSAGTKALTAGQWCEVDWNGTAWVLTAAGAL